MLLITIDEKNLKAKYLQIIEQIKEKIETQSILPGDKLPSTRKMAQLLGVHRTTVGSAYQELWAAGYIDLRPGACPRVRKRIQPKDAYERGCEDLIQWGKAVSEESDEIYSLYTAASKEPLPSESVKTIDLGSLDIDRRLYPVESFRLCLNNAVRNLGAELLGYGSPAGYLPLKQSISKRLKSHGVLVEEEELLITNGIQQGLDLILRLLGGSGKAVVVEAPTYKELIPLLRYYGLKVLEVPMLQNGMDLDVLQGILDKEAAAFIYTMPSFHNPTGVSTDQEHRERLLAIAEKYRIPIVEDGFEEEMKYFGKAILPIKSMDRKNIVLYCGTFSKVLFPGVRIGWVAAAKECIDRLAALRRYTDLGPSMVLQAAVHEYCEQGFYDRHISRMHRVYKKRMQSAVLALRKHVPRDKVEWKEPNGGYLIWLKLTTRAKLNLDVVFLEQGVRVAAGECFFYSEQAESYFRISISALNEEETTEGIQRLGKAMEKI